MNKYVQWGVVWLLVVITIFVILCYIKINSIYNITLISNGWDASVYDEVKDIASWIKEVKEDMEFYYMHS